jgi:hypothetical protein
VKPLAEQSLYEILDVPPGAGAGEIAAALDRTLSLIGPGSLAMYSLMSPEDTTTLARRVEEARATLLDPAARARYDAALSGDGAPPPAPAAQEPPPVIPALKPEQVLLDAADDDESDGEEVSLTPSPGKGEAPAPQDAPEPGPERPAHTPAPGGHVWPAPQPPVPAAPPPAEPAPLQLTAAVAPPPRAPILLRNEVPAARPAPADGEASAPRPSAPPAPPAAIHTPAPREAPIPEFASWTGDALRSVREARGLSLSQLSERTKVTRHHLENIESDRYTALPAPVYLRGILLSLARELRLDGQKISRSYLERMAAALAPPPPVPPRR